MTWQLLGNIRGKDGEKAPSVDVEAIALQAAELIPRPLDGKDGTNGKDAPTPDIDQIAAKAALLVPIPKDGKNGIDGKDAIAPDIDVIAAKAAALIPRPIDGRDGLPGRDGQNAIGEKGVDGRDGKDGADGLGMDDLEVLFDGERTITFKWARGDRVKSFEAVFPVDIYRGVWVDHKTYERGDGATWGGSLWHCNRTTTAKPGDGSKDWTLKAKRGSDGRDGKMPDVAPVVKLERSHA